MLIWIENSYAPWRFWEEAHPRLSRGQGNISRAKLFRRIGIILSETCYRENENLYYVLKKMFFYLYQISFYKRLRKTQNIKRRRKFDFKPDIFLFYIFKK